MKTSFFRYAILSIGLLTCMSMNVNTPSAPVVPEEPNNKGPESFASFLSHFPKASLPFQMGLKDFEAYHPFWDQFSVLQNQQRTRKKAKKIHSGIIRSPFIPDHESGRFSRMGPPELTPVARFYLDDQSVAVIYKSTPRWSFQLAHSYTMIRYDLQGNILPVKIDGFDAKSIPLGQTNRQQAIGFSIDTSGKIHKTTYQLEWEDQKQSDGQVATKIKSVKTTSYVICTIDDQGQFLRTPQKVTQDRV